MNAIPQQVLTGDVVAPSQAAALDRALRDASPAKVIEAALATVGREQLALVSSFGTESAALLKVMADVDPSIPVIFLDTGWLFEETLAYRDTLIATLGRLDRTNVLQAEQTLSHDDPDRDLWFSDPDACCRIRKVMPLDSALEGFDAWITGRKRFHGGARLRLKVVEHADGKIKFNPLANWTKAELDAYAELHELPAHPLVQFGYPSVGCWPCTKPAETEDLRSGRWAGSEKTECGIHVSRLPSEPTVDVGGDI